MEADAGRKVRSCSGRAKAHERFQRFFGDTALAALWMTLREIAENPGLPDVFQAHARPNSAVHRS
jgi:hypothetical protein